jgi:hypothetical protein
VGEVTAMLAAAQPQPMPPPPPAASDLPPPPPAAAQQAAAADAGNAPLVPGQHISVTPAMIDQITRERGDTRDTSKIKQIADQEGARQSLSAAQHTGGVEGR